MEVAVIRDRGRMFDNAAMIGTLVLAHGPGQNPSGFREDAQRKTLATKRKNIWAIRRPTKSYDSALLLYYFRNIMLQLRLSRTMRLAIVALRRVERRSCDSCPILMPTKRRSNGLTNHREE
jgi:hypothetical protein